MVSRWFFLAAAMLGVVSVALGVTGQWRPLLYVVVNDVDWTGLHSETPEPPPERVSAGNTRWKRVMKDLTLVPWPQFSPAMRESFDQWARKTLYRKECQCLLWTGSETGINRAEWPLTDDDRRNILADFGASPFLAPSDWWSMPPQPAI